MVKELHYAIEARAHTHQLSEKQGVISLIGVLGIRWYAMRFNDVPHVGGLPGHRVRNLPPLQFEKRVLPCVTLQRGLEIRLGEKGYGRDRKRFAGASDGSELHELTTYDALRQQYKVSMPFAPPCVSSVAMHAVIGQKPDRGRSHIRKAENSILIAFDAPFIIPRLRSTTRIINMMSGWEQAHAFADILSEKSSVRD